MSTTQAVPQREDTAIQGELYMSFELGDKKWKLPASDGGRGPSRYNVDAGDTAAVAHCIGKARERCKLEPLATVHSCYEAAPRANMSCRTYPQEISEQRGRYDDQPTIQGSDARSEQFVRFGRIGRSPEGD